MFLAGLGVLGGLDFGGKRVLEWSNEKYSMESHNGGNIGGEVSCG